MPTQTSRDGFILVMTLMLLAIMAVVLAAAARSSMGLAVSAVHARQELQRKWGNYSIRHAALQLAPSLLEETEEDLGEPVGQIHTRFGLNGHTYAITVSDEQAKVNINALLRHKGRDAARTFTRDQISESMRSSEIVLPTGNRVLEASHEKESVTPDRRIVSINHLLPGFSPDPITGQEAYPFTTLTCWGDGRINITRAPDELVKVLSSPLLGDIQISRLRDAFATHGDHALDKALAGIGMEDEAIPAVMERLSVDSNCYSVWIHVSNSSRNWHELNVIESSPDKAVQQRNPGTDAEAEAEADQDDLDRPPAGQLEAAAEVSGREAGSAEEPQTEGSTHTYPRMWFYEW